MYRSVRVALRQPEQPDNETWARVSDLVQRLADDGVQPAHAAHGFAVKYVFQREDDDRLARLLRELERAHAAWGAVWQEYRVIEIDPEDFQTADLLLIVGVGLDDQTGSFILNEDHALGAPSSCPECGTAMAPDRPVTGTLRIDESRLGKPAWIPVPGTNEGGDRRPTGTWDLVTLPNLGVVASLRLVDVLKRTGATGWRIRPVQNADGQETDRLALLEATSLDARPCVEHTRIGADGVCSTCGLVRGEREAPVPLHVRRSDLGGLGVVSTGQFSHGPLVVTRGLFDALTAAGLDGVVPIEPRRVCDH
ncbi:MAG: hypothetical protein ACRDOY_02920 [Nocardioidaceae bacterium]